MAVTSRLQGLNTGLAIKGPVLVASTGNLTLESTQVIDGIAVSSCDRVLVKDQTDAGENGIYEADTGTWSRTKDFNGSLDAVRGTLVYVNAGTVNAGEFWKVDSTGDNIPGTNDITFAEAPFSGTLGQVMDTNDFAINLSEGSSVVASTSPSIWVTDGNTVRLAESTGPSIVDFSTAPRIGAHRWLIFNCTATLVHSTTSLICPSSANISILPGDAGLLYAESTVLTRILSFMPRDHRHYSALNSVSSSGAVMTNSGVSSISSASATAQTYTLSVPVVGSMKEILIDCTASAINISNTATSILFRSSGAGGSTVISFTGAPPLRGEVMVLRGLSATVWQITSKGGTVSS